jgi:hypothetical protein
MDIQSNPFALANQVNADYGRLEIAAAQLRVVNDAAKQQASGVVKLVESATQSKPTANGTVGNNLDVWA